jgi:hypothetical protein
MLESLRAVSDAAVAAAESDEISSRERPTVNFAENLLLSSSNAAQLTMRQTELLSSLLRNVHSLKVRVLDVELVDGCF